MNPLISKRYRVALSNLAAGAFCLGNAFTAPSANAQVSDNNFRIDSDGRFIVAGSKYQQAQAGGRPFSAALSVPDIRNGFTYDTQRAEQNSALDSNGSGIDASGTSQIELDKPSAGERAVSALNLTFTVQNSAYYVLAYSLEGGWPGDVITFNGGKVVWGVYSASAPNATSFYLQAGTRYALRAYCSAAGNRLNASWSVRLHASGVSKLGEAERLVPKVAAEPAYLISSTRAVTSTVVSVPGTANVWLAGTAPGTRGGDGYDTAPAESPVQFLGLPIVGGQAYTFSASGLEAQSSSYAAYGPAGDSGSIADLNGGSENGIGELLAPIDSLIGVFLTDSAPTNFAPPTNLNFSSSAARNFLTLSPLLQQPFYIGAGMTTNGVAQHFVAPAGATRLFLGAMDAYQWNNNLGGFVVSVASGANNPTAGPVDFAAARGTYRGLFAPVSTARGQDNSGSFELAVSGTGAASGLLTMGNRSLPLAGKFNNSGALVFVSKAGRKAAAVTVTLQLDSIDQSISGAVSDGTFSASLTGDRAVYNAASPATAWAGRYTFIIPGTNDPAAGPLGYSYGTATVDALGGIRLAGGLADGTSFSAASVVSKDGYVPLYIKSFGGGGSLWSWLLFTNQPAMPAAALSWINPGSPAVSAVYPLGFNNSSQLLTGETYLPGQALAAGLGIEFQGGNLPAPLVIAALAGNTNRLSLHTNANTGVITGSFADPENSRKTIAFGGVILQGETNVAGYFIRDQQGGSFLMGPSE